MSHSSVKSFDRYILHKQAVFEGFSSEIVGVFTLKLKAIVNYKVLYYFGSVNMTLKFFKTAVALAGFVFLNACSKKSVDSGFTNVLTSPVEQIVGGTEVTSSKLVDSLFVLVVSDNNGTPQICTGTFISKKHILTAAHCVNESVESLSLITGVKPLSSDEGVTLTPVRVDINPYYNEKSVMERNDLAIITVAEEILIAKKDLPQFPSESMIRKIEATQNFEFMAIGYGKTTSLNPEDRTEGVLRSVRLKTSFKNSTVFKVDQTLGKGVCYGDSGGPALKIYKNNLYLLGIASGIYDVNGTQIDECQQGSLYMNIAPQLTWIRSVIN